MKEPRYIDLTKKQLTKINELADGIRIRIEETNLGDGQTVLVKFSHKNKLKEHLVDSKGQAAEWRF